LPLLPFGEKVVFKRDGQVVCEPFYEVNYKELTKADVSLFEMIQSEIWDERVESRAELAKRNFKYVGVDFDAESYAQQAMSKFELGSLDKNRFPLNLEELRKLHAPTKK
jgi:hypothetical protein